MVVTPFKTAQITAVNRAPESAPLHPPGIDLFADTFTYWREQGFDFVRYDSVDHIFDSADGPWPLSDRPAPDVLREVIARHAAMLRTLARWLNGWSTISRGILPSVLIWVWLRPAAPARLRTRRVRFPLYDWLDAHQQSRATVLSA
ncbi:MAG: hypothetical protein IPK52_19735 [Chloroflexi bacterium]|nr:hypothetical protein [Chloroflexota bacterium]